MNSQFSFYVLQQLFSRLLYTQFYLYSPFFTFFVLLSGLATSLNPCLISIFPILLIYLNRHGSSKLNFLGFIFGLLTVEIILSYGLYIVGYKYYIFSISLPFLSAIFSVSVGLSTLQIFKVILPIMLLDFSWFDSLNRYLKNFWLGGLLAINIIPCTLPIVVTILSLLLAVNDIFLIYINIITYIIGYIVPLIFLYFFIQYIKSMQFIQIFTFSKRYALVAGSFMVSSGVFKALKVAFYNLK